MISGMSKRSAVMAVIATTMLSILFLFSVSSSHFNSTTLDPVGFDTDNLKSATCVADTSASISLTREQWDTCLDPGTEPAFYLSIVIVTRMDDYAGNQHHRVQNHIDSAHVLAERTRENMEILLVEWNPPKDRRRIVDAFRFRQSKYLTYRIITISEEIHGALPNRGNAPLHEFEGKNVGIRFARGEFVVCTNQDDIWSHNFHNAIQSHAFQKDVIYLQHQDRHNIHDNLPESIVNLHAFPDDDTLYGACKLGEQDWGNFQLPNPAEVTPDNLLILGDQAGDFTMAHRDTWKKVRGYRESGGVAWVDIEFIGTARWTFDVPIVYSDKGFTCHQEHENIWEKSPDRMTDNKGISMAEVMRHEKEYVNEDRKWALQQLDIWNMGLECFEFSGGLCW